MARSPRSPRSPSATFRPRPPETVRPGRPPLPVGDRRLLFVLVPHLCFLPWALGTMHPWSQLTSLGLGLASLLVVLFAPTDAAPPAWWRLIRFPPFWIGLGLLLYLLVQAGNPSWRYATNGTSWWLTRLPDNDWLPTSVDTPFARFNLWRQFIIYAAAWLTLCAAGVGLTRRRSCAIILASLAFNALVLALIGLYFRFTQAPDQLLWLAGHRPGAVTFASFIYKNHAGAYLSLAAVAWVVLAVRYHGRSLREQAPSSPALLYALGAGLLFGAVIYTYSRGAALLLGAYLLAAAGLFILHRLLSRTESTTPRVVTFIVSSMVLFVVVFATAQLDLEMIVQRFELLADGGQKDISILLRHDANSASLDMLSDRWPRGVGAGGFRFLFPEYIRRYEASYQGGQLFWEHAHNDWLELPIELGAVGVALLATGAAWWVIRLVRLGVWRRLPTLLLALGLLQTPLHAVFDFPYQNPAILITWLMLAVLVIRWTELRPGGAAASGL